VNYCALLANDAGLTNICHEHLTRDEIDSAYLIVTDRLVNYAILSFPVKRSRPYCKPYWCDDLDVLHSAMSVSRDDWYQAGRPRDHTSKEFIDYKSRKTAVRAAHRRCVESLLSDLDRDPEDAAFRDSARFWKLLRSRKGESKSTMGAGITFEGTVYRSREDICKQWAKYFRTLHSCSDDPHFDSAFESQVTSAVSETLDNMTLDSNAPIEPEFVENVSRTYAKARLLASTVCATNTCWSHRMLFRQC